MIKHRSPILIIFLFVFVNGWGQEPVRLSLKQAEDLAIRNNYQLNASLHRLEQGYYVYKASKAYFKPKFSLSSELEIAKNQRGLDSALRMIQPLFDKVAFYTLKESQIQWEILRLDVQRQICELLFQVREAYYTVLLNQAHLAVDQIVVQLWEEELKRQKCRLELGLTIPFEFNQVNLHLKEAWSDYYATQSEMRSSQIKLLTILGFPPHTVLHLVEQKISLPSSQWQECSFKQWKQWALQYCPKLKQQQFSYLLSQNKISQTKAENVPTLSFYANAGHRYINNGFDNQPYIGLGLNLDWTLYDPSNQQRIKQAREGSRELAASYCQLELEIDAMIDYLLVEMDKAYVAYLNSQERAVLAEEGVRMATKQHQLGLISSFEYRDAIKSLHEAQQQVNQSKFDLYHTYDQLIQQTGLDLAQPN
jgi:outer membrane protein TolC